MTYPIRQILDITNLYNYAEERCIDYFIDNDQFHHLNKDYSFKNDNLESIRARKIFMNRKTREIFTSLKNEYKVLDKELQIIKKENQNLKQENGKKDKVIAKLRKEIYNEKEEHKIIMQKVEQKDKDIKNLREENRQKNKEIWDKIRGANY